MNKTDDMDAGNRALNPQLSTKKCEPAKSAHPDELFRLGVIECEAGRFEAGEALLLSAVTSRPNVSEYRLAHGRALHALGRSADALAEFRTVLRAAPTDAAAHLESGIVLYATECFDAAHAAFLLAVQLKPEWALAHYSLAKVLVRQGRLDRSLVILKRAVALAPDDIEFHNRLVFLQHYAGDAAAIRQEKHRWYERHAQKLGQPVAVHHNSRDPERPLKIGYVSAYFRMHAEVFFIHPLLQHHNSSEFQVFVYSDVSRPDEITHQLKRFVPAWREISGWNDDRVAQCVRDDKVDILIDTMMHMDKSRLLAFARKPAPVQVTWLAYPGCTGLSTIDYFLTDKYLDPLDEADGESPVRLPESFGCYDPLVRQPSVNALPASNSGRVTFGCLNHVMKVNERVIALWARVLHAVDKSSMLILAPPGIARTKILEGFAHRGITGDRIRFVGWQPRPVYFAQHHEVDIQLDPFPYNGSTTLCDGLWMGVPAVSLAGQTSSGRIGQSFLTSAGLPELVAKTEDDYVRIASELANDLPRLSALRATLRSRVESSPLMDGPRFARNVEVAYREMWRRWCRQN